jgi:hypothetical protein
VRPIASIIDHEHLLQGGVYPFEPRRQQPWRQAHHAGAHTGAPVGNINYFGPTAKTRKHAVSTTATPAEPIAATTQTTATPAPTAETPAAEYPDFYHQLNQRQRKDWRSNRTRHLRK